MKPVQHRPLIVGEVALVPLSRCRFAAVIDAIDVPLIEGRNWNASPNGYAKNNTKIAGRQVHTLMHRLVIAAPAGLQVDHINGNRLDNRRVNLRLATQQQNQGNRGPSTLNRSGFRGVGATRNRWRAYIQVHGHLTHLGVFDTPQEAALAFDVAARECFGEFAWLNFPEVAA